jgi:hypothetical protein
MQYGPSAPTGPSTYVPYRLFSKPDAATFVLGGGAVGALSGAGTGFLYLNYAVAGTSEMTLDALALPIASTATGTGVGIIIGAVGFGLYELSTAPSREPIDVPCYCGP